MAKTFKATTQAWGDLAFSVEMNNQERRRCAGAERAHYKAMSADCPKSPMDRMVKLSSRYGQRVQRQVFELGRLPSSKTKLATRLQNLESEMQFIAVDEQMLSYAK
jgi:hypothetical protein